MESAAEDPTDTVVAAVDGDMEMVSTVKRSGRFSGKRRKLLEDKAATDQPEPEVKKRRRRSRRSSAIIAINPSPEGPVAGAVEKKTKATTRTRKGCAGAIKRKAVAGRKRKTSAMTTTDDDDDDEDKDEIDEDKDENGEDKDEDVVMVHFSESESELAVDDEPRPPGKRNRPDEEDVIVVHFVDGEPELAVADEPRSRNRTDDEDGDAAMVVQFERDVTLLSKRFGLPRDELVKAIESDAVPVLRKRWSSGGPLVTAVMLVVSPVVDMWLSSPAGRKPQVRYGIEPSRGSAACAAATLKQLMDELTKTMPSWSLSVATGPPPRYVISHVTLDAYGAPVVDKSVVLDRQFRASAYVHGRLRYEYCKRYSTATEIVELINELHAIGAAVPAAPQDDTTTAVRR